MKEIRTVARLLVFDASDRLLLFLHSDGHGREFWATPGGGVQSGETIEETAHREAAEELGIDGAELTLIWTGHSEFDFADRRVLQTETFFLVKYDGEMLGTRVQEIHQLERIIQVRWWSLEDIDRHEGLLFPFDLSARLKKHFAHVFKTQNGGEYDE